MRELTEADMLAIEGDMAASEDGRFTMPSEEMRLPRPFNIPPNIRSVSGAAVVIDIRPPVLVWRADDDLFNRGHVAAELALAALNELKVGVDWEETNAEHAVERLESFLSGARCEAESRARDSDTRAKHGDKGTLGPASGE